MEPSKSFEYLINKTQKLAILNEAEKKIITDELNYFLKQSLTDPDRRHHKEAIRNKWTDFQRKVIRTRLLIEPKGFFLNLYDFVGTPQKYTEDAKEIAKFDNFEMKDFFEDLFREFENRKIFFSPEEETLTYCGLKFLYSESKLPDPKRDRKGISKTFRSIKPALEKYGCFYKYAGAKGLSSRLRVFITGTI